MLSIFDLSMLIVDSGVVNELVGLEISQCLLWVLMDVALLVISYLVLAVQN